MYYFRYSCTGALHLVRGQNFLKNPHFSPPNTHISVCQYGGKKCQFFGKFCVRIKWMTTRTLFAGSWNYCQHDFIHKMIFFVTCSFFFFFFIQTKTTFEFGLYCLICSYPDPCFQHFTFSISLKFVRSFKPSECFGDQKEKGH